VGFIFSYGPETVVEDAWKEHLLVQHYYQSFEEAVDAEYTRLE